MIFKRSTTSRPRRGSAFLLILGVTLAVTAISLGAITVVRSQMKYSDSLNDSAEARMYALSAIELGRYMVYADSSWRNNHSNGTWIATQSIGKGTYSLDALNPNGAMNNSNTDPLILTGTGSKGFATQKVQVTLSSAGAALTCLGTVATAGGGITTSATYSPASKIIASGANFTASSATVNCNAEAVGSISGSTFRGTQTPSATARTLPNASTIFSNYTSIGTTISYGSLPSTSGVAQFSNKLLSATVNPFGGGTNSSGVYVIDCQNSPINITGSRIVGTLVLLNCPSSSTINGSVNWTPFTSNYPCLLVQGSITINMSSTWLAESTVNFNPSGTPYNGISNSTTTDLNYTSAIQGLVYVSGNVSTSGSSSISMLMVSGSLSSVSGSTVTFAYSSTYQNNPPPGFTSSKMDISSLSWKQIVGP